MDFKGLTWVGDIYQKFEAVCLEVEEVMYQDAAKYVENQMQTVGASMRKFYSDVIQDLLPPSSADPLKVGAADLSLNQYGRTEIHKRQKPGIKGDSIEVGRHSNWDSKVIAASDANRRSSSSALPVVNPLRLSSSEGSAIGACSEPLSRQTKYGKRQKSSIVERKSKSKENLSPLRTSRSTTDELEDCVLSCHETTGIGEATSAQMAVLSPSDSVKVSEHESPQKKGNICSQIVDVDVRMTDPSINITKPDMVPSVKTDAGNTPNDLCTNHWLVSAIDLDISGDFTESVGRSTDGHENNDVIEPELEILENIDQFGKSKLEETCILVDVDKHCFSSQGKVKHKSNMIREAFCSKKMTARKQEYRHLAAQHGDIGKKESQETIETGVSLLPLKSNAKLLPTQDSCEPEWELL